MVSLIGKLVVKFSTTCVEIFLDCSTRSGAAIENMSKKCVFSRFLVGWVSLPPNLGVKGSNDNGDLDICCDT